MRFALLAAVSLFCLTCLVACRNLAAPDQLTVVQGTVTSYETGRPLPGVRMAIDGFENSFSGRIDHGLTGDSVRTDAQGHYQLSFRNKKGLFYSVVLEPIDFNKPARVFRLGFAAGQGGGYAGVGEQQVAIGQTNTVNFKPNELRTVAVRIRNRNTGYQRLDFNYQTLHGNTLDTLAYLRGYYLPPAGVKFQYYNYNPTTHTTIKDTLVALVVQNPASLAPDTVRASLTFGH